MEGSRETSGRRAASSGEDVLLPKRVFPGSRSERESNIAGRDEGEREERGRVGGKARTTVSEARGRM